MVNERFSERAAIVYVRSTVRQPADGDSAVVRHRTIT